MQSLTSAESLMNEINGDNELLTLAVALAVLAYQAVKKQRQQAPLSLVKEDISERFDENALAGADAIKEFPESASPVFYPRIDGIVGAVFGGVCVYYNFTNLTLVFVGAVASGVSFVVESVNASRNVAAFEQQKEIYAALLNLEYGRDDYKLPAPIYKRGIWGYTPTSYFLLAYGILIAASAAAEGFGWTSLENVGAFSFAISVAVGFTYATIQADILKQMKAEQECYKAARKAFALRAKKKGISRFF